MRIYELSADGLWLEPLTRPKTGAAPRLSASEGAIGRALSSGQAMVLEDALELAACEAGGSRSPASKPASRTIRPESAGLVHSTPRWLLPLRAGTRTEVLVTVAHVDVPRSEEQRIARAVRAQLQLFWRQLSVLRTLSRHLRTDRQTGMLERGELLNRLDDVINEAIQKPEPVTVLALALEGLRRLDDVGCWRQRDLLVQELGRALRAKIRADDVVGRFSDDRFIVVLRGLDATLATRVAEKLLQTVRTEAIHTVGQPANEQASGEWALELRGGLAGTGAVHGGLRPFATFDGQTPAPKPRPQVARPGNARCSVRSDWLNTLAGSASELATDLMAGVPDSLAPIPDRRRRASPQMHRRCHKRGRTRGRNLARYPGVRRSINMIRRGLSLVEAIIVIVIIGLLAVLAVPRFSRAAPAPDSFNPRPVLVTLRSAIELYYYDHGAYPGQQSDGINAPGSAAALTARAHRVHGCRGPRGSPEERDVSLRTVFARWRPALSRAAEARNVCRICNHAGSGLRGGFRSRLDLQLPDWRSRPQLGYARPGRAAVRAVLDNHRRLAAAAEKPSPACCGSLE